MTEMLLPRIARQGTNCLNSIRGQAQKARIEKFEIDEGFQPRHPPLPNLGVDEADDEVARKAAQQSPPEVGHGAGGGCRNLRGHTERPHP